MALGTRPGLLIFPILSFFLMLAGCDHPDRQTPPPPRSTERPTPATESSTIAIPIDSSLDELARRLNATMPRTLWTIDQRMDRCIPPQRVSVLGADVKLLPAIPCALSGQVTRGPITLRGSGTDLVADIPIDARITARDVKGRLKGETATGSARVEAHIRPDLAADWTPTGRVRLQYRWTTPPGIDLLGLRINFTDRADRKLRPFVRDLERKLPAELAKLRLRDKAEEVWRSAFTSILLNRENPPVWMRITPQRITFGGYRVQGRRLRLNVGLEAVTETFVGERPADPAPSPLPALGKRAAADGLRFFIPVTADYRQLEPVVLRALAKRSHRPFVLPGIGPVTARFDHLVAYGTTDHRIAVGIDLQAWPSATPQTVTRGRIWLTARPMTAPGSARITFADLAVTGDTDGIGGNMLLALGTNPAVAALIADALQQDLSRDLDGLVAKIRHAVAVHRAGDFVIRARIDGVETGIIEAAGDGVHLPVRATGTAEIQFRLNARSGPAGKRRGGR